LGDAFPKSGEGRAEGRAEGIEMGVNQNKIDNARRMKQKGFSTEDIAEITGLGKDEIDAI
jgi:predicted transposase/invertase (TIGR01784 family)